MAGPDTRPLARELLTVDHVPYTAQIDNHVVRTTLGDYVQVLRCGGASFESADDEQLNSWHERLNLLWRNLASPNLALWSHVVRRREALQRPCAGEPGFSAALRDRYYQRLAGEVLMVNEIYLAIVYRPAAGVAGGALEALLNRHRRRISQAVAESALETCSRLLQTVCASLARYEPQPLGIYQLGAVRYSAVLELLAFLINGEWQRVPLPRGPLNQALASSRLLFGREVIEYRTPHATRVGAMLGIREYPTPTLVGMYNALLSAPFAFVLTQSFAFLSKPAGQGLLQRQMNRLTNAGDFAVSQARELQLALDALTSNEFVMGEHHLSLQVLAEPQPAAEGGLAADRLQTLHDHIASARSLLADTGMTVAREDLALEAAFWAQLPGNFPLRPRKAPISSRNFAAMSGFHTHPSGRRFGNHWGESLALFLTNARSGYHFSLHASDPRDRDGGSRRDTGHTFICGPTGSGKTVFIGFLLATLEQRGVTQIVFDKDHGLEILVRAMNGEYLGLQGGSATGFNPLQLPPLARHVEFLKTWLGVLVRSGDGRPLTVRQQQDMDQALRGTLALDAPLRRLSRLIEFLDPTDPEGIHARLSRWCAGSGGDYAWVFDNAEDKVLARLSRAPTVGFDVTDFIEHELLRAPVTLYLFHLVRELLDGRKLVCWMDEFWRLLADPAFESFAKDGPKTWRKLNGVMCLATQSPGDVLQSSISRTIIEQTPTKVFFPNAEAAAQEYMDGFGLSEREFRLIRERLEPGSRKFLLKQGHHSVVCQLDLKGFDQELNVISGRRDQLERMRRLIAASSQDPNHWLPLFLRGQSGGTDTTTEESSQCA
ncbi:MAG: VirB4 family type IV secretion/conjugal transfer ATPase [Steroidobacteraceae bacterium]